MIIEQDYSTTITSGKRFLIEDKESGSRGIMPIIVDDGYEVEVIKVDKGILQNREERACDYMLIARDSSNKTVCMTELKGTDNAKEISYAYNQISQSIKRIPEEYIKGSDYLMAAVAGAQDKTLPSMINKEKRNLCSLLFARSQYKVIDMNKLVIYVQPNNRIKKAVINKSRVPCVIECSSRSGGDIPVPSMLLEAINKQ